ncbi:MAG: 2-oxoglutarate and iron-dependent oxygenase domain-containing protein, partial [Proteobacteria bacterium]|nr:2-oxoglutarate and iron-dependent oxygenase domain-containing protein [Pseudomonadota bacterium]
MSDVAGEASLDTVATIDLAPLADASEAGRREVADALRSALERVGFFILVNHGGSRALIQRTFGEAERFHDQPMEAKHA